MRCGWHCVVSGPLEAATALFGRSCSLVTERRQFVNIFEVFPKTDLKLSLSTFTLACGKK